MSQKHTWEAFFDAHAPIYDRNEFSKHTSREVDFLLEVLDIRHGASILDVGCGTGRHSVELARRGFAVTGLDLSYEMLARAADAAEDGARATRTMPARFVRAKYIGPGSIGHEDPGATSVSLIFRGLLEGARDDG